MKERWLLMACNVIVSLAVVLTAPLTVEAQGLPQEEQQRTLDSLSSSDPATRIWALGRVREYKISEALPILQTKIWEEPCPGVKARFLDALGALDGEEMAECAHRLIDSAGEFERTAQCYLNEDSLRLRTRATYYLIKAGDYSTVGYIFDILGKDTLHPNALALSVLKDIVQHVPPYSDSARTLLRKFARDAPFFLDRTAALSDLDSIGDSDAENIKLWVLEHDPEPRNRFTALLNFRSARRPDIREILYDRLDNEPVPIYRALIAEMLLGMYSDSVDRSGMGIPADYKKVADALALQPDSTKRFIVRDLTYFRPQRPADSISIVTCVDSLVRVKDQVTAYNWLGDQNFVTELDSVISQARTYAVGGDSNNCARSIKAFQNSVDTAYHDSLHTNNRVVTIEGWKFLYYKSQYILDRLPLPPPQYGLTVAITGNGTVTRAPDLPLYDSASVVQVTANPTTGYKFAGWSGDTTGTTNPITIPIYMNRSITGSFAIDHNLSVPAKFSSIQAAVNFARHGDTVTVSPGTYNESVTITSKDSLVVLATGGVDQVTVQSFSVEMSNAVVIRGFDVNASGLQILAAISLDGDTNVTIDANQIRNCSKDGISLPNGGAGCIATRIVNNRIHDNARYGIDLEDVAGGIAYLINNTIVKNSYYGVYIDGQQAAALVNNIVSFNTRYGVYRNKITSPSRPGNSITPNPNPSIVTLLNNLAIGNNGTVSSTWPKSSKDLGNYGYFLDATDGGNITTAGNEGTGVSGSSNQSLTTVFISGSPLDLHLKSGAVAINHGINNWNAPDATAGSVPTTDFEGTARPMGATVDMGADEAQ